MDQNPAEMHFNFPNFSYWVFPELQKKTKIDGNTCLIVCPQDIISVKGNIGLPLLFPTKLNGIVSLISAILNLRKQLKWTFHRQTKIESFFFHVFFFF